MEQCRCIERPARQRTQFRHRPARPCHGEPFTRLHTVHDITSVIAELPDSYLVHDIIVSPVIHLSGTGQGSVHMPYRKDMARREVLVQLDDELIERLAVIADAEGTSRSELLRRGARAVIEAADLMAADAQLIAAYQREPHDQAFVEAATQLAARTATPW